MSNFSQLVKLFANSANIDDPSLLNGLHDIYSTIQKQRELRFFVDGTPNCGHQAATVHLLKRIIDLTGYGGRITVIYADIHKDSLGRTAEKLSLLLTGFDPRQTDTAMLAYGSCTDIRFLNFENRDSLSCEVEFGFTAAADDMRINFAAELKTRLFLRLQPRMWEGDPSAKSERFYVTSRIETMTGRCFYLTEDCLEFTGFPYRFPIAEYNSVNPAEWEWYGKRQTFNPDLKIRTNNAKALYDFHLLHPDLSLWPIYGLHHFKSFLPDFALNLVLTALQIQRSTPGPIVAVLMNSPLDILGFEEYVDPLAVDVAGGSYRLDAFKSVLATKYQRSGAVNGYSREKTLNGLVTRIENRVKPWVESGGRIITLARDIPASGNAVDLADAINEALSAARNYDIILVNIGPLPGDIFNYFYANAGLPGIFEGQHTSSLSMSMGRPFLHIIRENAGVNAAAYTPNIGDAELEAVATEVRSVAIHLLDQRFEQYLKLDEPLDPAEYFSHIDDISTFILKCRLPSSDVSLYFRSLGNYFQADIHDKCVLGLIAMALCS